MRIERLCTVHLSGEEVVFPFKNRKELYDLEGQPSETKIGGNTFTKEKRLARNSVADPDWNHFADYASDLFNI